MDINLGLRFAKPHESLLSLWRRCLVSNTGLSLNAINVALRNKVRDVEHTDHDFRRRTLRIHDLRLIAVQPKPVRLQMSILDIPFPVERHCPRCAANLYHTDLFGLLWIQYCPIHDIRLTETCPACNAPWPGLEDLPTRACALCGRTRLRDLRAEQLDLSEQDVLAHIPKLYEFVTYPNTSEWPVYIDKYRSLFMGHLDWWKTAPLESNTFLDLQLKRVPGNYSQWLAKHRIVPSSRVTMMWTRILHRMPVGRRLIAHNEYFDIHIMVAKKILNWISRHAGPDHEVYFSDYRFKSTPDFTDQSVPEFCPYCLAFSIWILISTLRLFSSWDNEFSRQKHPFIDESGYLYFTRHHPVRYMGPGRQEIGRLNYLVPDTLFEKKYFQRSLEVEFLDYMYFSIQFFQEIREFRNNPKRACYGDPKLDIPIPHQNVLMDIKNEKLYIYYIPGIHLAETHLLDPKAYKNCKAYHEIVGPSKSVRFVCGRLSNRQSTLFDAEIYRLARAIYRHFIFDEKFSILGA